MAVPSDERLLDIPMRAVRCDRCGARVRVRKGNRQQTSIQWDAAATALCAERRSATAEPGPNGGCFRTCAALRDAIRRAAADGTIPVPDEDFGPGEAVRGPRTETGAGA